MIEFLIRWEYMVDYLGVSALTLLVMILHDRIVAKRGDRVEKR